MKERRFEPMEMEERDVVTFTDEEGNEFELDVIEYFEYEGQEYAVLMDLGEDDADEGEDTAEVYIMKIVVDGDTEEFLPADEDKMDALVEIVEELLSEECECESECACEGACECESGCGCDCDK
ncbi:MAG: DUF1292 domain-containing protein [Christensenellaceae bacterium]|jgi:uncharacterized protein YrzB (UPF0473 family)|nr:DUF1292 domain-containing protein [Christensenellaceae bacterium]PWM62583.1 MAG: DUF1292 domain-containing protein [Clostridia bacterium]